MKIYLIILVGFLMCRSTLADEGNMDYYARQQQQYQEYRQKLINQGNQAATNVVSSAQSGATTQSTNYDTIAQSSLDTMNNSQQGQSTAFLTQAMLAAQGAQYAGQCGSQNYAACVTAAIMFAMSAQAGQSGNSFNAPIGTSWQNLCNYSTSTSGCASTPDNPYTGQNGVIPISKVDLAANEGKIHEALQNAGYNVDLNSGTIKTPDGKTINVNDPSSMQSALGDNYDSMMKQVDKMQKDALAKVNAVKKDKIMTALGLGFEGKFGAMGSGAGGYDSENQNASLSAARANGKIASRDPAAQVHGLSKNFNGDPIGVAADSIFDMMSRRYQLKTSQKTFIGTEVH